MIPLDRGTMGADVRAAADNLAASLAALLVALAMSGVVRVVPPLTGPHRCACRAHGEGHECACRVCAAAARRAREGKLDELPPCHRGAAKRALAEEEEARARRRALPGVLPTCGTPEGDPVPPPAADPFPLPGGPVVALAEWSRPLELPSSAPRCVPGRPAVPPPRRAAAARDLASPAS